MIKIILIIAICAAALAGLIYGVCKGYTKTSTWGGAAVATVCLIRPIASKIPSDGDFYGLIVLGCTLGVMLVFLGLFYLVRKYIKKAMNAGQQLSYYKKYDEREENTQRILNAIDNGDKKEYRRNAKRKFKQSTGAWGVVNRVFGAITSAINGAAIVALIVSFLLLVLDFAQISAINEFIGDVLGSLYWLDYGYRFAFDFILVCLMGMSLRLGYKHGIASSVNAIIILALVCGAGYLSYHLAFNVQAFITLAESLAAGGLASFLSQISGILETIGITRVNVAQGIICLGIFLLLVIIVIVISFFLPGWVDKVEKEPVFKAVDGALGALIFTALLFGALAFIGSVVYTLNDLAVFEKFNAYMAQSRVADCMYRYNPFNALPFIRDLPLRGWFGEAA